MRWFSYWKITFQLSTTVISRFPMIRVTHHSASRKLSLARVGDVERGCATVIYTIPFGIVNLRSHVLSRVEPSGISI